MANKPRNALQSMPRSIPNSDVQHIELAHAKRKAGAILSRKSGNSSLFFLLLSPTANILSVHRLCQSYYHFIFKDNTTFEFD